MAVDRGHREDGRGWILLHRRPKEGPHPLFRVQCLPAGSRGSSVHASGGGRGRGDWHPGRLSRRIREGVHRPQGRATATESEIVAFCKERLAAFKVPKAVEFVQDLPKSLVGKVLRRELRERELAASRAKA